MKITYVIIINLWYSSVSQGDFRCIKYFLTFSLYLHENAPLQQSCTTYSVAHKFLDIDTL